MDMRANPKFRLSPRSFECAACIDIIFCNTYFIVPIVIGFVDIFQEIAATYITIIMQQVCVSYFEFVKMMLILIVVLFFYHCPYFTWT